MISAAAAAWSLAILTTTAHADLEISKKATKNVTCSGQYCAATASKAVLNEAQLASLLAAGNVIVDAGKLAKNIDVNAEVSWTSVSTLYLDSFESITVNSGITVAGNGGLMLSTNDGGQDGTFSFLNGTAHGYVQFWNASDSLVINGNAYKLVTSVGKLASAVNAHPNGYFALANNYNAKNDGTYKTCPVPELDGVFEGLGNVISNLKIAVTQKGTCVRPGDPWNGEVGLFGFASAASTIENITLLNADVTAGDLMNAGALVGSLEGNIFHGSATGTVSVGNGVLGGQVHSPDAGGLVGEMDGPKAVISKSVTNMTSVTGGGSAYVGALVGGVYNGGQILGSFGTGNITAGDDTLGGNFDGSAAGGLIGLINNSSPVSIGETLVSNDAADSIVVAGNAGASGGGCSAGGLIGAMGDGVEVKLSYSFSVLQAVTVGTGTIGFEPYASAGGLVGNNYSFYNVTSTIDQSYTMGAVSGGGTSVVGGFIGYTQGAVITNAYATGPVTLSGSGSAGGGFAGYVYPTSIIQQSYSLGGAVAPGGLAGGFVGNLEGTLSNDYWDTDTSGISGTSGCGNEQNCLGVTGLTTAQFQSGLPDNFSPKYWAEKSGINNGFPYLRALAQGNHAKHKAPARPMVRSGSTAHAQISQPG